VAPVYSNNPATVDRQRQRVAFLQPGDGQPGDGDEAPQWPSSRPNMYETDWEPRRRRRGRRRARQTGRTVSILLVLTAAAGGVVAVNLPGRTVTTPTAVDSALQPRASTPPAATRGKVRVAPVPSASAPAVTASRTVVPKSTRPPEPVAGLDQTQMNNAAVIVRVAQDLELPRRAMLVAMMTGMQESSLRNLANPTVPGSFDRPNEGDGSNFDSLGIFQQRPSQGWGTVAQLMTPRYAAKAFYEKLLTIEDWESRTLGAAAQAVQRSALPDAYDEHEERAARVVDALL
jgi:hypothetical protein